MYLLSLLKDYVIPFVIALSGLVFFHELGHYLVARAFNVKILTFSLGFGKKIWGRRFGPDQTEWQIGWIPLGGFVRMVDEAEGNVAPEDLPRAFSQQTVWKRFAIVAAGPVVNLLLAVVLYWGIFVGGMEELRARIAQPAPDSIAAQAGFQQGDVIVAVGDEVVRSWGELHWVMVKRAVDGAPVKLRVKTDEGQLVDRVLLLDSVKLDNADADPMHQLGMAPWTPKTTPVFRDVVPNKPAALAGFRSGDKVLAVGEHVVDDVNTLMATIAASADQPLRFRVKRAEGSEETLTVVPVSETNEKGKTVGRIGVQISGEISEADRQQWHDAMFETVRYGPVEAISKAAMKTWESSVLTLRLMGRMILGKMSWKSVSGPISIANYAGKAAQLGFQHFMNLVAALSVGLGILNLLPIPVLDGGRLLYYLYEIVRGEPLSERVADYGQRVGLALILMLMVVAFFNDISRLL